MAIFFDTITTTTIGNEVKTQIDYFDSNLKSMSDLLAFGLNDDKYSSLYTTASNISLAIGGVCLALAVIYTYFAIVKEGITLRGDWKRVVEILLKLAITKGLIDSGTEFITWFYSFFAKISELVLNTTGDKSGPLGDLFNADDIAAGLGVKDTSGLVNLLMADLFAKILGLMFFALGIIVFIIAISRLLKIYVLLSFGSVKFAKIPLSGFESCKDYFQEMAALGLQGGIIAATICFFEVAASNISTIIPSNSQWGSFANVFILAISMILVIFKSEEIAKKVF